MTWSVPGISSTWRLPLTIAPTLASTTPDSDDFSILYNDFLEHPVADDFNPFFIGLVELIERCTHPTADDLHFW